ncbi:MAG: MFS transporter [Mycobacteriales bacterium]
MTSRHPLRELLALPDLRRLLYVRLAGQAGDGLFQTALILVVFFDPNDATSAGQAALAFAVLLLPFSLVGPFAGVFLDRWRRQRVLRNANLGRAGLVTATAALLATLGADSLVVQGFALLVISTNRFILAALSAALPHVVAKRQLVTANAVTTTLGGGAFTLGAVAATAMRPAFGSGQVGGARTSLLAAGTYLLAALLAARITRDLLGPDARAQDRLREALGHVARGVAQGAQHVRERGPAFRALAAISAHRFFYGLSTVATLLLYTPNGFLGRQFAGEGAFGGLIAVGAVAVLGGLSAALVTPAVTRRLGTQRWIVLVFSAAAVAELVFGLPYTHGAFLVAAFFLGFAAQAGKICVDTLVQESVEDDFRGRVFSFYDTLFNVSFVLAAAASAVVLPEDGKSYAVIGIVAGGYTLTALLYGVFTARRAAAEPPEPVVTRG